MTDFWRDSGYPLLGATEEGRLAVSDDFLRAYLMRPEVRPVEESCAAERALHESLMAAPRRQVDEPEIARIEDSDARGNYRIVLNFRDRLLAARDIEACYLASFTGAAGEPLPPLFLDHMVHVILRHILDGTEDGLRARAGELLFREQRVTIQDGRCTPPRAASAPSDS